MSGSYNYSYDYRTQHVTGEESSLSACEDMNAKIQEWNTTNPTMTCLRTYRYSDSRIVFE